MDVKDGFYGDYYIKNDEILKLILDGKNNNSIEEDEEESVEDNTFYQPNRELFFNIKLKNGREYNLRTVVNYNNYNKIIEILREDEDYIKNLRKQIVKSDGKIQIGNIIVDDKAKKKIEKIIDKNFEDINFLDTQGNSIYYITKLVYKNHRIMNYEIPLTECDELFKYVAEYANSKALDNIKGYKRNINVLVYNKKDYIDSIYNEELLKFIEDHYEDEFNPEKKYYILDFSLQTRNGEKSFIFYTNSTKKIDKIIEKNNTYEY